MDSNISFSYSLHNLKALWNGIAIKLKFSHDVQHTRKLFQKMKWVLAELKINVQSMAPPKSTSEINGWENMEKDHRNLDRERAWAKFVKAVDVLNDKDFSGRKRWNVLENACERGEG